MMSTTSLKLPADIKQRIADVALLEGKTSHAFMVEALEHAADQAQERHAFEQRASAALAQVRKTGKVLAHEDVKRYITELVQGKKPKRPIAMVRPELIRR